MTKIKTSLLSLILLSIIFTTSGFSQDSIPEFEVSYQIEGVEANIAASCSQLSSGDYMALLLSYPDFSTYQTFPSLIKLSPEGEAIAEKHFYPVDGRSTPMHFIVETPNNEILHVGTRNPWRDTLSEYYMPDVKDAVIFINKLDENLNVAVSKEYEVSIDTAQIILEPPVQDYGKIIMFQVFCESDGFWTVTMNCVSDYYKEKEDESNDTLWFYKFDFDGNLLQAKSHALENCHNHTYGITNAQGAKTNEGYSFYFNDLDTNGPWGRRLVLMNFDFEFNFIDEVEQSSSSPECYTASSVKSLSNNSCIVSSTYHNINNSNGKDDLSLTIFNSNLTVQKQLIRQRYDVNKFATLGFKSIDFIDENRIFWVRGDNIDAGWGDNFSVIELVTLNLEMEQSLIYDIGDNHDQAVCTATATADGGLLICGEYVVLPERESFAFITKFPAEAFLGIEEAHKYGLKTAVAYPNPGRNELNIKTGLENARIEVYNVQGGRVFESEAADKVTTIDASGWNSGIYLWKVMIDGKVVESGKWVKE